MQADRRKSLEKGWSSFFKIRNKDNRRTSYAAESAGMQKTKVSDIKKKKIRRRFKANSSVTYFYQQSIVCEDEYSKLLSLEISQKFK